MEDRMPVWLMAAVLLLAVAAAYIIQRVSCDVALNDNCATDTECECMYGEDKP
jgi:hypothetical protein